MQENQKPETAAEAIGAPELNKNDANGVPDIPWCWPPSDDAAKPSDGSGGTDGEEDDCDYESGLIFNPDGTVMAVRELVYYDAKGVEIRRQRILRDPKSGEVTLVELAPGTGLCSVNSEG